jgi:hypothetical protein
MLTCGIAISITWQLFAPTNSCVDTVGSKDRIAREHFAHAGVMVK